MYFFLVPKILDIDEDETVCKKVVDKDGNIIAGCTGYIYPWAMMYIDDVWVDEKYRRQELGSNALQAVEKVAEEKGATKINSEEIFDWNVGFFLKNGYKVSGEYPDFSKGFTYYLIEKDI